MAHTQSKFSIWLETVAVAVVAGLLFKWIQAPLEWVLGPMVCLLIYRMSTKRPGYQPLAMREFALAVLGYLLGSSFTWQTGEDILVHLPLMLLATVLTVVFSLSMGYWVAKRSGTNMTTSIFGSVPGGLTQMVVLAAEVKEADVTVVTFMQTFRLIGVIFLVPFLAVHGMGNDETGQAAEPVSPALFDFSALTAVPWQNSLYYVAAAAICAFGFKRLRLPSAFMLGPLFGTTVLVLAGVEAPHLPPLLLMIAQLFIGINVGLQMDINSLHNIKRLGLYTILSSILLVLFALVMGTVLTQFSPMSVTTGFLSTAPGGMAEMGITAQLVHADLSMVTGYHVFRIFFIMFAIPPILLWWLKKRGHSFNRS